MTLPRAHNQAMKKSEFEGVELFDSYLSVRASFGEEI